MKKLMSIIIVLLLIIGVSSTVLAAKKDTVAPSVTNTYPKNNETDVMIESKITFRFDEKIQKGKTIADISFVDGNSNKVSYNYEIKDNMLIIIPKDKLKYDMDYKAIIPTGAVQDRTGTAMAKIYVLSFLTEENSSIDKPEEDSSHDNNDAIQNADTVNLKLEIDAYNIDDNLNETDKTNIISTLKKSGIYVRGITEEIILPTQVEYGSYDIVLEDPGSMKIQVTKLLRETFGYSSRQAKDIVDKTPCVIAEDRALDVAESVKRSFEEYNAVILLIGNQAVQEDVEDSNGGSSSSEEDLSDKDADEVNNDSSDTDTSSVKDVILVSVGGSKLQIINILKSRLPLSLSEVKALVDNPPALVVESVTPEEAQSLEAELEQSGAEVDIVNHEEEE